MHFQALCISEEFLFLHHFCSLKKVAEEETPFYRYATRDTEIVNPVLSGVSTTRSQMVLIPLMQRPFSMDSKSVLLLPE